MNLPSLSLGQLQHTFAMLSRFPIPYTNGKLSDGVWCFPIVGAAVGVLQFVIGWVALSFGASAPIAAGLMIISGVLATGGLHEDGLADTCDAMGAWDKERRLEIMRDSTIGTYGTLGLILGFGLRWVALSHIITSENAATLLAAVLLAAMGSRAAMGVLLATLPPARTDGLGHGAGKAARNKTILAILIAVLPALILCPSAWLFALLAISATAFFIARLAMTRIGGQTGDILGCTQISCEIAALTAMSMVL